MIKGPEIYSVVLLNYEDTPIQFVADLLKHCFELDQDEAIKRMVNIHEKGGAECGRYPLDLAETKAAEVADLARRYGYRLRFITCTTRQAVTMAYQFEFFRRTRDIPGGKTVRRTTGDFDDLQTARAYCIAELRNAALVDQMDGCRIYRDGVYEATVSAHAEC
jgi:ATP-dependent Clp protease adaptor protein ClpS